MLILQNFTEETQEFLDETFKNDNNKMLLTITASFNPSFSRNV